MALGWGQKRALIRLHFGITPKSIDEMASCWSDFKYLVKVGQIPVPNIPLKFT